MKLEEQYQPPVAKKRKRLTKEQIIEYYSRLAFPSSQDNYFVPVDLRMKAFEKLLQFQEIPIPSSVEHDGKPQKWIIEIKQAE
jgi:hypothetical protein